MLAGAGEGVGGISPGFYVQSESPCGHLEEGLDRLRVGAFPGLTPAEPRIAHGPTPYLFDTGDDSRGLQGQIALQAVEKDGPYRSWQPQHDQAGMRGSRIRCRL